MRRTLLEKVDKCPSYVNLQPPVSQDYILIINSKKNSILALRNTIFTQYHHLLQRKYHKQQVWRMLLNGCANVGHTRSRHASSVKEQHLKEVRQYIAYVFLHFTQHLINSRFSRWPYACIYYTLTSGFYCSK